MRLADRRQRAGAGSCRPSTSGLVGVGKFPKVMFSAPLFQLKLAQSKLCLPVWALGGQAGGVFSAAFPK